MDSFYDLRVEGELDRLFRSYGAGTSNRYLLEMLAFTNGCFDLLHIGHVKTLEFIWEKMSDDCDSLALIVGVNTDRSVRELKGPGRPIVDELDRVQMLLALSAVSAVVLFDDEAQLKLLLGSLRPDVYVKGGDYRQEDLEVPEGTRVTLAPYCGGISTTEIIEKIRGPVSRTMSKFVELSDE